MTLRQQNTPLRFENLPIMFAALCLCLTLCLCLMLETPHLSAQDGAAALTIDQIRNVWQERQQEVRTVVVKWKDEATFPKSFYIRSPDLQERLKDAPDSLTTSGHWELRLDGDRFDIRSERPEDESYGLTAASRTSFDGDYSYSFDAFMDNDPTGIKSRDRNRFVSRQDLTHMAVMLAYRPLDSDLSPFVLSNETKIAKKQEIHHGRPCIVLEHVAVGSGDLRNRLWIDSDVLWPRRYESLVSGVLGIALDIVYEDDPMSKDGDQLPKISSWESATFKLDSGQPKENSVAHVTQCEINVPIDPSEFTVVWPPGTLVIDEVLGTSEKLAGGKLIQRGTSRSNGLQLWWVIGTAAIGIAILCGVWLIRRRAMFVRRTFGS